MASSTKYILVLFFTTLALNTRADYWTQETNFPGPVRGAASGFAINGKCYVGIGWKFSVYYEDLWEYDPQLLSWSQKADFGGGFRLAAVSFSIGGKGYITTGGGNSGNKKKDLWEYNPDLNTWTQKTDFPGSARNYATGFALDGYGYVGTGEAIGGGSNDFYRYDPVTDTWSQVTGMTGFTRSTAVGFSVNGKGYVGTGYGGGAKDDIWEYDPILNAWSQKADLTGGARSSANSFSICDKGYICAGLSSASVVKKDMWEYDPVLNTWTQKADLGSARSDAVGFSDGSFGYISCGFNQSLTSLNDFWRYTPDCNLLPVSLSDFTAVQKDDIISISWKTNSEMNSDYFTIEKSFDATSFYPIDEVAGAGTSIQTIVYLAEDHLPVEGLNYYRLRQTDFDGTSSYSKIVAVNFVDGETSSDEQFTVFPVPAQTNIFIKVVIEEDQDAIVSICNEYGDIVFNEKRSLKKGQESFIMNISSLPPGSYFLRMSGMYSTFSRKIILN
jgi:N-acetylneuraminic acid mutarotase